MQNDKPDQGYENTVVAAGINTTFEQYKNIFTFLITRMFYQDALNALFVVGGVYASLVVGMSLTQVLILGIILNVFSGPSAIYGGYLNDAIGSKNVINISLWGLLISGIIALSIDKDTIFYFISVDILELRNSSVAPGQDG